MGYTEKWYDCPNQSGRGGSGIAQVTFHTTEGAQTGESLANWICQEQAQASYHAAVDNSQAGEVHRFVDTDMKAWSQAGGNPFALSVAFCTPSGAASSWSRDKWLSMGWMLDNGAAIAKTFCDWYGIPLTLLNASQAQSGARGISQHSDGGSGWSGHHDCGSGFPEDDMIRRMGGQPGQPPSGGPPPSGGGAAPPLHVDYFGTDHNRTCPDVQPWQQKMYDRGWREMIVDGDYGPISKDICWSFQQEKGLHVDGYVGPETWNATWNAPVT
jgi:peptidoglycan hydrolase-like protein with peptidoglycan-binding domain